MTDVNRVIIFSIGIIMIFIFGIILSHMGRPYRQILFNVHKLIALVIVIVGFINVRKYFLQWHPSLMLIIMIGIAGLCIISLFASGAMLSIGKVDQNILKKVHVVSSILMAGSSIVFLIEVLRKIKV